MEYSVDFKMTFGAPEALHSGQKNNFRLLAFYNTMESCGCQTLLIKTTTNPEFRQTTRVQQARHLLKMVNARG